MDSISTYKHTPLLRGKRIRLLCLQPARELSDPVKCTLHEQFLEGFKPGKGPYEALSYVWGSPRGDQRITCDDRMLLVTQNCLEALQYLRHERKERVLFVDAICIDQTSTTEKTHQVELMGLVYKLAKRVIVWLGVVHEHERQAKTNGFLPSVRRFWYWLGGGGKLEIQSNVYMHLSRPAVAVRMLAFSQFGPSMPRDWFTRVWTMQELLLASDTVVVCGSTTMRWDDFSFLVSDKRNQRDQFWAELSKPAYNILNTAIAKKSLDDISHQLKYYDTEFHGLPSSHALKYAAALTAWEIFACSFARRSSEPLDKVYGLYGILTDLGIDVKAPDYTRPVLQVYKELVVTLMSRMDSIEVLTEANLVLNIPGWPSWVPDFAETARICSFSANFTYETKAKHFRVLERLEYGPPRLPSGFGKCYSSGTLLLRGLVLGSIERFGSPHPASTSTMSMETYLQLCLWLAEMYDKTLCFANCPSGLSASSVFAGTISGATVGPRSYKRPLKQMETLSRMVKESQLFCSDDDGRQSRSRGQILYNYQQKLGKLRDFESSMRGNFDRFCMYDDMFPLRVSNGCVGMGYFRDLEAADLMVKTYGATTAIILRPHGNNYRLVGRAILRGFSPEVWPPTRPGQVQSFLIV